MTSEMAVQGQAQMQPVTPMHILQLAVQGGAEIGTIERLVALQQQMMDREAEREFNEALSRCQSRMKRIAMDMENPQTRSKYASFAQIDRAVRPIYTEEGFALSFSDDESSTAEYLKIVCHVSRGGHTRIYRKGMPVVTVGAQGKAMMTPTHATGAADSYAKRYLVKDIFNLALGQDDTDGNGSPRSTERQRNTLTDADVAAKVVNIEGAATLDECKRMYECAREAAESINDNAALKLFVRAKDRRKSELQSSGN